MLHSYKYQVEGIIALDLYHSLLSVSRKWYYPISRCFVTRIVDCQFLYAWDEKLVDSLKTSVFKSMVLWSFRLNLQLKEAMLEKQSVVALNLEFKLFEN